MSRSKYQRPEVYLWIGKSKEKFWKVEWRQYIAGRETPKHRAASGLAPDTPRRRRREAADKLIRDETAGPAKPDGSMSLAEFWEKVFWPVRRRRGAPNTLRAYEHLWNRHVRPVIGKTELQYITKNAVESVLCKVAGRGMRQADRPARSGSHEDLPGGGHGK